MNNLFDFFDDHLEDIFQAIIIILPYVIIVSFGLIIKFYF